MHLGPCVCFTRPTSVCAAQRCATRLRSRHTETEEQIHLRLARAEMEMGHQDQFDVVLVNDDLETTVRRAEELVREHVAGAPQQPSLFERD